METENTNKLKDLSQKFCSCGKKDEQMDTCQCKENSIKGWICPVCGRVNSPYSITYKLCNNK